MAWKPGELLKTTKSSARYLSIINKLSSSPLTATAAYKEYHDLGLSASRSSFFDAIKYFRYARQDPYQFLPSNQHETASPALIPHSGFLQKKRHQAIVEYEYFHPASGQVRQSAVTVSSNDVISEANAYKIALEFMPKYDFDPDSDLYGIRVASMRQSDRTIL